MRIHLMIAATVFINLLIATKSAEGGGLDSYIPVSPVSTEVKSAPIPDVESPRFKTDTSACNEQVAQEQKCIRDYVAGNADEEAFNACSQTALEAKYLCLKAADRVAYAPTAE